MSEILGGNLNFGWRRRVPMIMQAESTECGLVCVAMIAGYFGHEVDLRELRGRYPPSLRGTTLARVIQIASHLNLMCRPVRLELEHLRDIQTPCILHWNMNHFVVLTKVKGSSYWLHDPTVGERVVEEDEVSRRFTGVALELTRGPDFEVQRAQPTISLRKMVGNIFGLRRALAHIFSLALALEFLALLGPIFLQSVADRVLVNRDADLLLVLGFGFLLVLLLQSAVSALRTWLVIYLGANLNLLLSTNVFAHLLRLSESYFQQRHVGDIVSRFESTTTIQQTLTTKFVEVILDGLMASLTLVAMLAYSPTLALVTIVAFFLYGIARSISYRATREATHAYLMASARQQSTFLEALRGARAIKLHNQEATITAQYANRATNSLNKNIIVQRLTLVFSSASALIFGAQRLAILWLGALIALKGYMSIGALLAFVAYSDQFTGRASALVDYYIELRMLRLQAERLADIVLAKPEAQGDPDVNSSLDDATIEFQNVSFRYSDTDPWVCRNLNFRIEAGECVALVGPSGCGKSTLAKLVVGLLEPQEGAVLIGGIDLKRLGRARVRGMSGAVMQDDHLFAGSIADNISFFDTDASQTRIEAAAHAAAIHEDVSVHPMGYQALVGDMGSSLSGGQKQRVILARALYRHPKLLVLDEATSHLDVETERKVSDAVRRMKITRLVVAHRPETIATADRVITLGGNESTKFSQSHASEVK